MHILSGERCDAHRPSAGPAPLRTFPQISSPAMPATCGPTSDSAYASHSVSVVSVLSVSLWHSHWTLQRCFEKAWLSILTHDATQYRVLEPASYGGHRKALSMLLITPFITPCTPFITRPSLPFPFLPLPGATALPGRAAETERDQRRCHEGDMMRHDGALRNHNGPTVLHFLQ